MAAEVSKLTDIIIAVLFIAETIQQVEELG